MFKHTKRVQKPQKARKKRKTQQFLQRANNKEFQMVLIDEPKQPIPKPSQRNDQNRSPPNGFKPLATSTPKRKNKSLKDVNAQKIKHGPRLTMSQFIGELPKLPTKHDKPKQVAVKLRNFINKAPNTFETFVIDDFTDNDECQLVVASSEASEESNLQILDITIDTKIIYSPLSGQPIGLKKKKETILLNKVRPPSIDTFQNRENQNVLTRFTLNDLFKKAFNGDFCDSTELLQTISSLAKLKVQTASIPLQPPVKERFVKPCTNDLTSFNFSSLFNVPEQRPRNCFARSRKFEKELQRYLQVDKHQHKHGGNIFYKNTSDTRFEQLDNFTINGARRVNRHLKNGNVEFWKSKIDLSFLDQVLKQM